MEILSLITNLSGQPYETINFKKQMEKRISNFLTDNDLLPQLRSLFEKTNSNNDGKVTAD